MFSKDLVCVCLCMYTCVCDVLQVPGTCVLVLQGYPPRTKGHWFEPGLVHETMNLSLLFSCPTN